MKTFVKKRATKMPAVFLVCAFLFAVILILPAVSLAAASPLSLLVYGDVKIDNNPAPAGTNITVENGETEIISITTSEDGKYSLEVPAGNTGKFLIYKINGISSVSKRAVNPENTPSDKIDLWTNTSFLINNNSASTASRKVVLNSSANRASRMMVANSSDFAGANWENYVVKKEWNLTSGNGEKIVYVKFKDAAGNILRSLQDAIILDEVVVLGVELDAQIANILDEAGYIYTGNADIASSKMGVSSDKEGEASVYINYIKMLFGGISGLEQLNVDALTNFTAYGTPTTKWLGSGERAGVINSYYQAFNKLPQTEEEWADVIKIANGRWPSERSETAEARAKQAFEKVYLRAADINNSNDNAAVTIIAYGLRSDDRNLDSEKAAVNTFNAIYGYNPVSAIDWDITRAIAYSGAVR